MDSIAGPEKEYEIFSLNAYAKRLTPHLQILFDNIWIGMSEKTALTRAVLSAGRDHVSCGGLVTTPDFPPARIVSRLGREVTPPGYGAFAPSPMFWTRLSPGFCHWERGPAHRRTGVHHYWAGRHRLCSDSTVRLTSMRPPSGPMMLLMISAL